MKPGPVQISILALLVVAILLQVTLLVRLPGSGGGANTNVEQLKTVASALQRDALYGPAAEYFERYLEMADLEPEQTANMLYTVGQMYQENLADPEQALALYVRLLELYPDSRIADKARKARVICLQSLGRDYDAQRSMNQLTTTGETDKVAPSAFRTKNGDQSSDLNFTINAPFSPSTKTPFFFPISKTAGILSS